MDASLWSMGKDAWALCDGPGPVPFRTIVHLRNGAWLIDGDAVEYSSLKAAAAAQGYSVEDLKSYDVTKDGEARTSRTVITYDNVLERLKTEGWIVVGKPVLFDQNRQS